MWHQYYRLSTTHQKIKITPWNLAMPCVLVVNRFITYYTFLDSFKILQLINAVKNQPWILGDKIEKAHKYEPVILQCTISTFWCFLAFYFKTLLSRNPWTFAALNPKSHDMVSLKPWWDGQLLAAVLGDCGQRQRGRSGAIGGNPWAWRQHYFGQWETALDQRAILGDIFNILGKFPMIARGGASS